MTDTFKIKRRTTGSTGGPSSLKAGEPAYNEMDNTLYFGFGDDGSGNATSIQSIAGPGAFVSLNGTQTVTGAKSFTGALSFGSTAMVATPTQADSSMLVANTSWVKSQNYLIANQVITVTGDVSGAGATAIVLTLPNITTAATSTKITFNAKGQVTGGAALAAADIPTLTHAAISDFDTQVRLSRLDQMALPTSTFSANGQILTGLPNPINPLDAANKQYVDASIQGLTPKPTATVATFAALPTNSYSNGTSGVGATITASASGVLVVDSYTVRLNDIILVKNESNTANNGLYVITTLGTSSVPFVMTRHPDMDSANEFAGAFIPVGPAGSNTLNSLWLCNPSGTVTVGSTAIPFTQLNSATQVYAGNGISVSATTISVLSANSGRISVTSSGVDLASGVVTVGTYKSVSVDTYGRVTSGSNPTTLSGFGIVDAQSLNANLTALSGLSGTANQLPYFTGAGAMTLASFTAFGQSLIASSGAAAVISLLGLGTMATQNAAAVVITGGTIDGVTLDGGTF